MAIYMLDYYLSMLSPNGGSNDKRGQPTLGQLCTSHLSRQDQEDLRAASTVLPGRRAQFEAAQPNMQRHSRFVDSELLADTAINF